MQRLRLQHIGQQPSVPNAQYEYVQCVAPNMHVIIGHMRGFCTMWRAPYCCVHRLRLQHIGILASSAKYTIRMCAIHSSKYAKACALWDGCIILLRGAQSEPPAYWHIGQHWQPAVPNTQYECVQHIPPIMRMRVCTYIIERVVHYMACTILLCGAQIAPAAYWHIGQHWQTAVPNTRYQCTCAMHA